MSELQDLSDVIGRIYDATLDRSLWPDTLARASRFMHVHSMSILTLDARRTGEVLLEDHAMDPHYRDLYLNKYIKLDPFVVPKLFLEPGEVVANTDIIPMEELERTRIFREWAKPQGFVDAINASLERSTGCVAYAGMNMCTPCDDEAKRRAKLLVPHFRRAILIDGIVDLRRAEAATFEAALDGLSAGVFFVDGDAHLKHANAAGLEMLGKEVALRRSGGRLETLDRTADRALQSILACAAGGDAALGTRGVALPLAAEDGHRHVAHVLPLGAGERRRTGAALGATAAVFVQPASLELVAQPVALARAFGLTVAETRVLVAIVDIGGVPAVADALGLAEGTIKAHLKSIFRKTGATRQADLVKLVAGFSSPFGEERATQRASS